MPASLDATYRKALDGCPLTLEEGRALWWQAPLDELMAVASQMRFLLNPRRVVTWQIDRNVNITNICQCGCLFCNFHCHSAAPQAYITSLEQYTEKIEEMQRLGGDQVLLQGGMHPELGLEFYCDLFRALKARYPGVRLHALGPPEVVHIAKLAGQSVEAVLATLVEAGLDSLPGAGAEILSERVRRRISPRKATAEQWLQVMAIAHRMGLLTSATMMYGHLETIDERLQHLIDIRTLQAAKPEATPGFVAFIAWPIMRSGTPLQRHYPAPPIAPAEHLRLTAVARLMLCNVPHVQASWLTVGAETAALSLWGGADDMGSIMIEENVVASAGAHHALDAEGMQQLIRTAGFEPQLRDQAYQPRRYAPRRPDAQPSTTDATP